MAKSSACWSKSLGHYGATVRIMERTPKGILYMVWIDEHGVQQKRSLGHRDRKLAVAVAELFVAQRTTARYGAFLPAGLQPPPEVAPAAPAVPEPAAAPEEPENQDLTFWDGVQLAWKGTSPIYPTETRHTKDSYRLLERASEILGPEMTWVRLRPLAMTELIRALARRSMEPKEGEEEPDESRKGKGVRTAEYMCDMIYKTASWLRESELIPEYAARPADSWKSKLKREWEQITSRSAAPLRLRHEEEEMGRLFVALPQADPRLRLLIELAAELRAGQAAEASRRDLDLGKKGGFGLGRFTVRGAGRKTGEIVDLHPELRAVVDEMLAAGYLSEVEEAYQAGEIEDYFLFPAGEMRFGKATVDQCTWRPVDKRTLRAWFRRLEKLAGVEHQEGRSLYGLRRQATDLAPEFSQDSRVLDRLSGHLHSETREQVYQDRLKEKFVAQAAVARQGMRGKLKELGEESMKRSET